MEELFKKYNAAWDALNPRAIADLYRLPCAISDSDGVNVFCDNLSLTKKLTKNCEDMASFGYLEAKFNILNQHSLDTDQVAVTIGWRIRTASQDIEFRALYICHQIEEKWYVYSANVYRGSFNNASTTGD
ncbi:hypothetical protein BZJ19_13190 [Salinivibrio proteolyticus]|uniref:hypothetical protein n=1 Tax=Salinivibrio proteolyticus TaxID=334715 RepID=UPI000988AB1B|nr:hypothetical protein [Salinivibrio proteolyticus]OOF23201.1 hypothetical protein BZJ19_13190 [Salinivibrio proteolyticus]